MKTIKFKAKRKKDNEWIFGSYGKAFFGYGISDSDIYALDNMIKIKNNLKDDKRIVLPNGNKQAGQKE